MDGTPAAVRGVVSTVNQARTASDRGGSNRAINVVVLFAPRGGPLAPFERSVAEWSLRGRAVLVVLPRAVDAETLARLAALGADLCVIAPTSTELFASVEQARSIHRRRGAEPPTVAPWEISRGIPRSSAATVGTGGR